MKPQGKTSIQEKREFLKNLSLKATELKEKMLHACENDTQIQAVNDLNTNSILIEHFYKNDEHKEFSTFKGWLKKGFSVQKGETAFLVWGRPNERKADGEIKPILESEDGNTFFPISFIFSNAQVKPLEDKKSA